MKAEDIKRLSREATPRKVTKVFRDETEYDRKRDKKVKEEEFDSEVDN